MSETTPDISEHSHISLRLVTADNLGEVIRLSDTLDESQRKMVAPNAISIAQAHFSDRAWFRAVYAGETPVGFMMVYDGSGEEKSQPGMPDHFLWRFMIAAPYQKMDFGRRALELLFRQLLERGATHLEVSCHPGNEGPENFYRKLGFFPSGRMYDDELGLIIDLHSYLLPNVEYFPENEINAPGVIRTQRLRLIEEILPPALRNPAVYQALLISLVEDLNEKADESILWPDPAAADITSQATLSPDSHLEGKITAKAAGVIAGLPIARAVFLLSNQNIQFTCKVNDGDWIEPGTLLAEISGPGPALLTGERPALNFLGRLSGIATLTRHFVEAISGTKATILDTRKTVPGLRLLDKYAVRMGGGRNHRSGLYDMILIKDNHIDGAGSLAAAVERARQKYGERYLVEVEVKNLDELRAALALPVDRIMLDNMDLETMRQAVVLTAGRIKLEASGNVSLSTVRAIAETGVDYISSGALTHSVPVLDISMRLR